MGEIGWGVMGITTIIILNMPWLMRHNFCLSQKKIFFANT